MMTIHDGKPCNSANYSSRGGESIKYIVIHYTAGNGDTAQSNCNYFAGGSRGASAHYFVGDDGIYRSVPDAMRAWHCGGTARYKHPYCRNANSIGIEMCSRKDTSGSYYIADNVVAMVTELTKQLMKKYNIPVENVLRHYDVWEKQCPAPFVKNEALWASFKKNLESEDESMTNEERTKFNELVNAVSELSDKVDKLKTQATPMIYNYIDSNMPDWAKRTVKKLVKRGIIEGNENGELMLTDDLIRTLVIIDRAGLFDS